MSPAAAGSSISSLNSANKSSRRLPLGGAAEAAAGTGGAGEGAPRGRGGGGGGGGGRFLKEIRSTRLRGPPSVFVTFRPRARRAGPGPRQAGAAWPVPQD